MTRSEPGGAKPKARPADLLDNSWERQIRRGALTPDRTIDLHGHTLGAAKARIDRALADAIADNARVLLVITGKPRVSSALNGERQRGAIRAEIGHWLETSAHSDRIASIRQAHSRHGGAGALYLILRRSK